MNIMPWLLLATLVGLFSYQAFRYKKREKAHQTLVNRVKPLRLYKMLQFLGADQNEFLRAVPVSDVNRLIERCSSCGTVDICDGCLRDGHRVDSMSFCPNYRSLSEHSKTVFDYREQ